MKPRWDDSEFNTPHEMLVRVTLLVCLAGFTSGILLVLAGVVARDLRLLAGGVGLLAVAGLTRTWLRQQGKIEEAETALQEFGQAGPTLDSTRIAELVRLLQEWETLERKRGLPGFDPWALQAIRHDIRVMVEEDPSLEGLFHRGQDGRRAA